MKSLQRHISQVKTLHSLNEFIEEKLIINKNFKNVSDWKNVKYLFVITLRSDNTMFLDIEIIDDIKPTSDKNILYIVSRCVCGAGNPSSLNMISDDENYMFKIIHKSASTFSREFFKIKLHQNMCEQFLSFINNVNNNNYTFKKLEDFFGLDFSIYAQDEFKTMNFMMIMKPERLNKLKSFTKKIIKEI